MNMEHKLLLKMDILVPWMSYACVFYESETVMLISYACILADEYLLPMSTSLQCSNGQSAELAPQASVCLHRLRSMESPLGRLFLGTKALRRCQILLLTTISTNYYEELFGETIYAKA